MLKKVTTLFLSPIFLMSCSKNISNDLEKKDFTKDDFESLKIEVSSMVKGINFASTMSGFNKNNLATI
ncbi:MAG: hypothetical protein EAZ35_06205 [Sphingobacteriia bacterium]|nr:MAG: hypothetical protein EAZ35_06205 [Sphingobacteriia bacterium]